MVAKPQAHGLLTQQDMARIRRLVTAFFLHGTSICLLIAAMVWVRADMRHHFETLLNGDHAIQLASVAAPLEQAVRQGMTMVGDYHQSHPGLVVFSVVGLLLCSFMFRS